MGESEVERFARAALHGDDEHKEWLLEAAREFVAGRPVPPARGSGNKEARIAELEREVEQKGEALKRIARAFLQMLERHRLRAEPR